MKKCKLFLLLGLLLLTGCSYSFEVNTKKSNDNSDYASSVFLVVPDVSGMEEQDAVNLLELNGFNVGEVILTRDYKYEDGLVIKTNPSSGTKINKEDVIDVFISSSTSYEVEDYVGEDLLEVKQFLEDLGILVQIEEVDSFYEEGSIVDQEPKVGNVIESGDTVILCIAG